MRRAWASERRRRTRRSRGTRVKSAPAVTVSLELDERGSARSGTRPAGSRGSGAPASRRVARARWPAAGGRGRGTARGRAARRSRGRRRPLSRRRASPRPRSAPRTGARMLVGAGARRARAGTRRRVAATASWQRELRPPSEPRARALLQSRRQVRRLGGRRCRRRRPPTIRRPSAGDQRHQVRHGDAVLGAGRSSRPLQASGLGGEPLGQPQVAAERIEHVLPRPHGAPGCARASGSPGGERADGVRDDAVLAPVAAADHVAGPHGGHAAARRPRRTTAVGGRDDLGRRLAGAVGIVARRARRPRGGAARRLAVA